MTNMNTFIRSALCSPCRSGSRSPSRLLPAKPGAAMSMLALFLAGASACDVTLHIGQQGSDGGDGPFLPPFDAADGPVRLPPGTHPPLTVASKLDLLFLVDDSSSMATLQQKMRSKMNEFMDVLKAVQGGLPDLHVAVVSSSLGSGTFGNVPGCAPNTIGDLNGTFQHAPACGLHAGESFISSSPGPAGARRENFDGDITDVFRCLADLGDKGCGFEHQFEATRLALQKALVPGDVNNGFLREDAYLAIVMLTNEDDCSVPANSTLFDPSQLTLQDPLGGLQSYRCNEFGHICSGGQTPPHQPPDAPLTLADCTSNEHGRLVPVGGFVDFLFGLKPLHPERIFVAAIAGPPSPYVVGSHQFMLGNGGNETQPQVQPSCVSGLMSQEFADPAIRIRQWTQAFGSNSFFGSICEGDFGPTMQNIAQTMVGGN